MWLSHTWLMLYLSEETPRKYLNSHPIISNAEIIFIEIHQLKHKWLLLGCYKLPIQSELLIFVYKILKICFLWFTRLLPIWKSKFERPFSNPLKNIISTLSNFWNSQGANDDSFYPKFLRRFGYLLCTTSSY